MHARSSLAEHPQFFPCSSSQQRFWFEEHMRPGNPALNVAFAWRITGPVTTSDLERAWNVLLARHGALRTSLVAIDGTVMQRVEPQASLSIPVVDLRNLATERAEAELVRLADLEATTAFDLAKAPLLRVVRVDLSDDETTLFVTAHHAICDGLSIGILAREMGELCAAFTAGKMATLPQLPVSYGEYATQQHAWLGASTFDAELEILRASLARYKPFDVMPDRPRTASQSSTGDIASVLLARDVTDRFIALANDNGVTHFMAALAALFALLNRYTGEDDIWIGSQVVGRDEVEFENIVGCFINTIPLHGDLAGDPTFVELLERTGADTMDALEGRHVPLERVVDAVRRVTDSGRDGLFSVNFIFQRSFVGSRDFGTFTLDGVPARSAGTLYDLNFFMVERPEGWRMSCEYACELFDRSTIVSLLDRFETMLRGIVADPTQHVSKLPLLDDAARRQLIVESNLTETAYPAHHTLPMLFEAQAKRSPAAVAIVCGRTTLTYRELDLASNRLARELQAREIAPGSRVGVFLERSAELVVALLAVMKAGCAYVPLDPAYPPERIAYISEQAALAATISRTSLADHLITEGACVVLLDADAAAIGARDAGPIAPIAASGDLVYVIYTSGSTGMPKGVQIRHRALVNLLWAMRDRPGLASHDTLVAVTTISFDIAALELYLPLVVGAKLVIAQSDEAADGAELLRLLRRSKATVLQATPVTWQLLLEAGWSGNPDLKMLCGGEALSRELAARLLTACGGGLWNMYGPTETTVWSSVVRVESSDAAIPIGPPIANTRFYVVGKNGELVPPGAPGELYIGGDGVAAGYHAREDLTTARFVPDIFTEESAGTLYRTGDLVRSRRHGEYEFLGRTDHQVKLRGFRIELGEIESALLRQPGVAEAVAVVGEDAHGEKALRAFVVPSRETALPPETWVASLRLRIGEFLPSYMIPSPIVALPELPRTPNGKIDRRALPTHAVRISEPGDAPPQTSTEARLAASIGTLLGVEGVGRTSDIFNLGFHSLLAVRLVTRIASEFGVRLPVRALFEHPTVSALAHRIDSAPSPSDLPAESAIVTYNHEGARTPFVYFHSDLFADGVYCRNLAASIGPAWPFHAVAPHGTHDLELLPTIEAMARDYFDRIIAIQPEGPYRLGGFCASALVAFELARLLRASDRVVEDVILINASAPPSLTNPAFDGLLRLLGLDVRIAPHLREWICYKLPLVFSALLAGPRGWLRFARMRVRAWSRRRSSIPETIAPSPFTLQSGTRETENSFAHLVAALTFRPMPYDGRVTLIWGIDQNNDSGDPTYGWSKLAREVRVVPMAGGHVSPLSDRVHELGEILTRLANE